MVRRKFAYHVYGSSVTQIPKQRRNDGPRLVYRFHRTDERHNQLRSSLRLMSFRVRTQLTHTHMQHTEVRAIVLKFNSRFLEQSMTASAKFPEWDEYTEGFLANVLPRLTQVDTAFHNGDADPRYAIWSHKDPVTLFGALLTKNGWGELGPAFKFLASRFSHCQSFRIEVIAAGASGDLGYIVGIEHTNASVSGAPPEAYELRVTIVFRREAGEWKVVHRHADPTPQSESARAQLTRFDQETPGRRRI